MTHASSAQASLMLVESARYALLRRLASAMRHQMVAHLQPISMVTELMERRLRAPSPDLEQLRDHMGRLNGLSKSAVQDCLDVVTWLTPEPGATMTLDAAVQDCLELLRSSLSFRGIALRSEVAAMPQPVGRAGARMLLPATLLAMTDPTEGPAELVIRARTDEDVVLLDLLFQRTAGEPPLSSDLTYRPLQWSEVEAMARAEDVDLVHTGTTASLSFPVLE